jgi:hypothetical protein
LGHRLLWYLAALSIAPLDRANSPILQIQIESETEREKAVPVSFTSGLHMIIRLNIDFLLFSRSFLRAVK